MKAIVTGAGMTIEIESKGGKYVVSGQIAQGLQEAIEEEVKSADAMYTSPAYGTRLGYVASKVAEAFAGTYVIEGEPPEEPGLVY